MIKGYEADLVEHAVNGSIHIRPRGFFGPICNMKKPVLDLGKTIDEWRVGEGNFCRNCDHAAKHFGYLPTK